MENEMKLTDRFLVIRRAVLVACNPNTEAVKILYTNDAGEVNANIIGTSMDKMKSLYVQSMINTFINNTDTSVSLHKRCTIFVKSIQDEWNEKHPDDQVNIVGPK